MDSELWCVLIEKTEGEAYDKVYATAAGDGMMAFIKMHSRFSRFTESGVTNRFIGIMKLEACKHDWEVAGAIEKWEESYRILSEENGVDELKESYRMVALKMLPTGDIKKHVELKDNDIKTHADLRATVMKWDILRKMEKDKQGGSSPEIGEVDKEERG